jgi:hypothetical protein
LLLDGEKILLLSLNEYTELERQKLNILQQLLFQKQQDGLTATHKEQFASDEFSQQYLYLMVSSSSSR